MKNICSFIEVDLEFYTRHHVDLIAFSSQDAEVHYSTYGYWEGRRSHRLDIRENFLTHFGKGDILEIGPYYSPLRLEGRVKYMDVLDQKGLMERARKEGADPSRVPKIDYISRDGSLDMIDGDFDVVISSHSIEHQPDFITHLNAVSRILRTGGVYALIIPNARYCFDALLPLTKISEIFNAYVEGRKRHSIGSVIEHRALTTHNDPGRHWQESGPRPSVHYPIDITRLRAAIEEFQRAGGSYIDVHAWQFDPASFSDICSSLISLRMINYSRVICYGPVKGRNEFMAVLLR